MTKKFKNEDLVQLIHMPVRGKYDDEDYDSIFIVQAYVEGSANRSGYPKLKATQIYPIKATMPVHIIPEEDLEIYRTKGSDLYVATILRFKILRLNKKYNCKFPYFDKVVVPSELLKAEKTPAKKSLEEITFDIETERFKQTPFDRTLLESGVDVKVDYGSCSTTDECLDNMRDLMFLEKMYKHNFKKEITIVKKKMAKLLLEEQRELKRSGNN